MNNQSSKGSRIAKVLSRSGIASRREAKKIILAGRVKVNGEILFSPAFNVPKASLCGNGQKIWLHHFEH